MPIHNKYDYSHIDIEWFLGDEGHISDYNQESPSTPGQFHPQFARLFLEYIQIGLTDRQACMEVPMNEKWPRSWVRGSQCSPSTFIEAYHNFGKPLQIDMMANDIVDISDRTDALSNEAAIISAIENPLRDALNISPSKNIVEYAKLVGDRVSSRKWFVSKIKPSQYGDKVQIDHGNAGGKVFKTIDYSTLSDEQIDKLMELDKEFNE